MAANEVTFASEAAEQAAKEAGLSDLEPGKGTGSDGAYTKADVEKAATADDGDQAEAAAEPTEDVWPRERFTGPDGDDLVGHPPHVVAGALTLLDQRKTGFTVSEVKAAVEQFLSRKVEA